MALPLAVILILAIAVLGIVALRAVRKPAGAAEFGSGPGARCGACGYDTTGLTAGLTCPECGADLRRVGITRRPTSAGLPRFAAAAVAFTGAWVLCGLILGAVVSELSLRRRQFKQDIVLSEPASRAYGGLDMIAEGSAWQGMPVPVRVRVELQQLIPSGAPPVPARLPAPMLPDPATGAYSYVDATGRRIAQASGFGPDAILAWLGAAGVNTPDARLRDEARAAWLAVLRAGRRPRAEAMLGVGGSSSATMGLRGPFNTVRVSQQSSLIENPWPARALAAVWLVGLAVGGAFLWRNTRSPGAVSAPG
jgi:hypothetical protein